MEFCKAAIHRAFFPSSTQGIEVEIPQYRHRRYEELQRKARFLALTRQKCAQILKKPL
jgi:hypothetical protein